ncbi:MAG: CPBP family intramembrane glutamic endopeptidase [Putridiphycobacter sp.]|nr:CPBP family intramembrane glutamic endopeptidase [Putridiphycobacter sp.]
MSIRVLQFVSFKKLTQRSVTLAGVILLLAIGVVFVVEPLADLILTHFSDHPWVLYQLEMSDIQNAVIGSLRGYRILIAVFVFAILPAICEELVFRGILYGIFKDLMIYKQLAMISSALVFAILHFQVLSVLPIFIVGYLLALLYEKTNNLLPSMLVHFAFNGLQIVLWQA